VTVARIERREIRDRGFAVRIAGAELTAAPRISIRATSWTTPMIRRFLSALVMIPAATVLGLFAFANRQPVTVSFDPFDASDTHFAMSVPLYVLGFTILIAGVLLGGLAAWLTQGRHRRLRSRLAAENAAIRSELASLREKTARPVRPTLPIRRAG
jgi:hypothetical protein